MTFANSVVGGVTLVRPAIQSPNFVTGVSGWRIAADGSVEFNNGIFRGTLSAASLTNTSIGGAVVQNSQWLGGTITDPDIVLTDTGTGTLLCYTAVLTTVTYNVSGNFVVPVGITNLKLVQAWGSGGGGGYKNLRSGGGGGEYAAEINLPVTPGETLTITVPTGGAGAIVGGTNGADGAAAIVDRSGTVLVQANGGQGGQTSADAAGGTGSTNVVHFPGGSSPYVSAAFGINRGGSSGGSSGGTSAAGTNGSQSVGTAGGVTSVAPTGGGNGGAGGNGTIGGGGSPGVAGTAPGGGGGAGGFGGVGNPGGAGAAGANGRVVITYQTGQTLDTSISPAAGVDGYGNAYIRGIDAVYLHADNRITGTTAIVPVAGVPTSIAIVFPTVLTGAAFTCQVTAGTSVPGTQVTGVGYTNLTNAGVTLWLTRTNNTATGLSYTVEGV